MSLIARTMLPTAALRLTVKKRQGGRKEERKDRSKSGDHTYLRFFKAAQCDIKIDIDWGEREVYAAA